MARTIGVPGQYGTKVIEKAKRSLDYVRLARKILIADIGLVAVYSGITSVLLLFMFVFFARRDPPQAFQSIVMAVVPLLRTSSIFAGAAALIVIDSSGFLEHREALMFGIPVVCRSILALLSAGTWWIVFAAVTVLGDGLAMQRLVRKKAELEREVAEYQSGVDGEMMTANALARLPDQYVVIHGLPIARGDIDHLVIGPTGIFVLDTKNMRGQVRLSSYSVLINGQPAERNILDQLSNERSVVLEQIAEHVLPREEAAKYWDAVHSENPYRDWGDSAHIEGLDAIQGFLVFPRADVRLEKTQGVGVMPLSGLVTYIQERTPAFDMETVRRVSACEQQNYADGMRRDGKKRGDSNNPNRFYIWKCTSRVFVLIYGVLWAVRKIQDVMPSSTGTDIRNVRK